MSPTRNNTAVNGNLIVSLEQHRGGDCGEMAGQVCRRETRLWIGVHGDMLTNLNI